MGLVRRRAPLKRPRGRMPHGPHEAHWSSLNLTHAPHVVPQHDRNTGTEPINMTPTRLGSARLISNTNQTCAHGFVTSICMMYY